uniref:Putative secreted protein n=1 Tax=Anopheles darlingi TaxID=43151 RepID=A0A2M4DL13_ANODA
MPVVAAVLVEVVLELVLQLQVVRAAVPVVENRRKIAHPHQTNQRHPTRHQLKKKAPEGQPAGTTGRRLVSDVISLLERRWRRRQSERVYNTLQAKCVVSF